VAAAIVTGAGGLVGSEAARHFHELGLDVVGIDNDMRGMLFGAEASMAWMSERLERELARYEHVTADVRDAAAIEKVFRRVADRVHVLASELRPPADRRGDLRGQPVALERPALSRNVPGQYRR
jgi:CDP-paratose 2-epimerase